VLGERGLHSVPVDGTGSVVVATTEMVPLLSPIPC
jgi:hypothetical protein